MNVKRLETWESSVWNVVFSMYLKFLTMYKVQKSSNSERQLVHRDIFFVGWKMSYGEGINLWVMLKKRDVNP
jgi:hypothetical protein